MANAATTAGMRAGAYFALARAFGQPRQWAADLPDTVREALVAYPPGRADLSERLARLTACMLEDREVIEVEHARLFVGPFEIRAAPWATFYLEDEPQLMGATSQYAAEAYAEAGLAPAAHVREVPDHIAHELEFMYYLAFQEATTGEPAWSDRQRRFWHEHLGPWLPQFAQALREGTTHDLYVALADVLVALAAAEGDVLLPVSS